MRARHLMVLLPLTLLWLGSPGAALAATTDDGMQYARLGDWEVHYSAFPSTFLQPTIANTYNITRSGARSVLNISVLDATSDAREPQRVVLEGHTLNEAGQRRELQFRRFIEDEAIYYVSDFRHEDDERLRFFITVSRGDDTEELRFTQQFYHQD